MPKPKPDETQSEFISRCIPYVINEGTTSDNSQAAAICHSIWRSHNEDKAMKNNKPTHYAVKSISIPGTIKDVDTTSRTVTGFFNAYNFLDSDGDVLMPGCAKKSIKERGVNSNAVAKIKHALNHDLTQLPGKLVTLEEKTVGNITGIYFESKMADTQLGNDTLKNYLAGIYDNHSIGFIYDQLDYITPDDHGNSKQWENMKDSLMNPDELEGRSGVYLVRTIKLFEGSTVAFGANSMTPFMGMAKGRSKESVLFDLKVRVEKLENTLRNGTQSDDMMYQVEIQSLQIQQMIDDLLPHIKFGKEQAEEKQDEPEQPTVVRFSSL